ncbi:MAG: hypothetical protein HY942_05075 [Gammaproteobacteria bacterium]|nr:hypothetical protein [Gammaproteobacteria bacterium]
MRKFVVSDAHGVTANGTKIEAGKYTHTVGASNDVYSHVARLCADSPLLAALQNPSNSTDAGKRLFQVDQWEVSVTSDQPRAYTVIKEVPFQDVGLQQKLVFAILALGEVYGDPLYVKWSNAWVSGADRGANAAHVIEQAALKEIAAADTLEALQAHGDISQKDLQATGEKANYAKRVIAVTRAAQLSVNDDPATQAEVAKLAAMATAGLSQAGKRVDLSAVAERAIKATAGA